jgi:hypothetical protein
VPRPRASARVLGSTSSHSGPKSGSVWPHCRCGLPLPTGTDRAFDTTIHIGIDRQADFIPFPARSPPPTSAWQVSRANHHRCHRHHRYHLHRPHRLARQSHHTSTLLSNQRERW